ncbi:hypothetical protein PENARI_c316G06525, partial [Penicillium arizonense]
MDKKSLTAHQSPNQYSEQPIAISRETRPPLHRFAGRHDSIPLSVGDHRLQA